MARNLLDLEQHNAISVPSDQFGSVRGGNHDIENLPRLPEAAQEHFEKQPRNRAVESAPDPQDDSAYFYFVEPATPAHANFLSWLKGIISAGPNDIAPMAARRISGEKGPLDEPLFTHLTQTSTPLVTSGYELPHNTVRSANTSKSKHGDGSASGPALIVVAVVLGIMLLLAAVFTTCLRSQALRQWFVTAEKKDGEIA